MITQIERIKEITGRINEVISKSNEAINGNVNQNNGKCIKKKEIKCLNDDLDVTLDELADILDNAEQILKGLTGGE